MLGRKRQKAALLHGKIDAYHREMSALVPQGDMWLADFVDANLNTKVLRLNKRRYNRDWERQHFYNFPLVTVISQLTTLQLNVCTVQGELLSACYRDALRRQLHATDSISEK